MINRLKELRLKNGLTLSELSTNVNIPTSTLSKYENQKRNLIGINLYKLSEYFSVSPSYLTGDDQLENVPLMTNLDDDNLIPFETHTVSGKQSTIAINQSLKWLDNDNNLRYTGKPKKDLFTHEKEVDLLKTLQVVFENLRDDIEIGLDKNMFETEDIYIHMLETYNSSFNALKLLIGLDRGSRNAVFQILNKMQNKKASDDKPETEG
ncbi:helix-turn-helix domain-containing protein [Leuconostoc falkenbergense]|uniref:helix-turn-helix domain-containing protein n=1 Tax=Leuconostoc falkenbergense TaxID=2766470 RepID=UPI0019689DBA|nr:helix-turn-helix transcriptional regulator [Leuconostoc falkenbergense]QSB51671.1 helix-turn-helix transcriptional regulator [Leuconostoc falkenbergense]